MVLTLGNALRDDASNSKHRFLYTILPNLANYKEDLTEPQYRSFENLREKLTIKKQEEALSKKNKDLLILRYIDNHDGYSHVNETWLWSGMASSPLPLKVYPSWTKTELKNHFHSNILPNLIKYEGELTD